MGTINPANNIGMKNTDSLFARIRKRLKSFDAAGLLDEGDWYYYVKTTLDDLGVAVYDEKQAVVHVCNFKGPMPEDFSILYAAYKCTPTRVDDSKQTIFPQTGFVFYIDDTYQPYRKCHNCLSAKIDYQEGMKFTTRTFLEGQPVTYNYSNPMLLKLSGNVKGICDDKCKNLFGKSTFEITIDNGFLYTNFKEDSVFMKYWALPIDPESGLPMIPDNTKIERAIETRIIKEVYYEWIINGSVPDIDNRYKLVASEADDAMKDALFFCKMPSFQNMINKIRLDRKNLRIYQQIEWY